MDAQLRRKQTNQTTQVISAVIGEDRPVYVLQTSRAEAEAEYGQAMYNNRHPVSLLLLLIVLVLSRSRYCEEAGLSG